ncbi:hypothetical protein FHX15_002844 [Rhizobium sp. BK650]|uniref:hypothetical protein n=1 Tax=Rhizobium sp. BK650 TaxID=2586990 RepID=UPI00161CB9C1|nr:hypothetical protein [Rhizobium sp. BK650]MBB3657612.1 hypothetical protein [Rhizobium sp. BK650]
MRSESYNNHYSAFAEDHHAFGFPHEDETGTSVKRNAARYSVFVAGIAIGVLGYWIIGNFMNLVFEF